MIVVKRIIRKRPLESVEFTDVAFKAQPEEPTEVALRGFAAILCEDGTCDAKQNSDNSTANFIDYIAGRQRRVVRSTFGAELNGCVHGIEQMLLLQCALHQIHTYIYIYIYIYMCVYIVERHGPREG